MARSAYSASAMQQLSLIGLILNTIGTILIWRYGLPQDVNRKGESFLALEGGNQREVKKLQWFDRISSFGMLLIVCGFVLQVWPAAAAVRQQTSAGSTIINVDLVRSFIEHGLWPLAFLVTAWWFRKHLASFLERTTNANAEL